MEELERQRVINENDFDLNCYDKGYDGHLKKIIQEECFLLFAKNKMSQLKGSVNLTLSLVLKMAFYITI
jgi:hypothetical protein